MTKLAGWLVGKCFAERSAKQGNPLKMEGVQLKLATYMLTDAN